MTAPKYTPFDGSNKLFQIGLGLLGSTEWLETDANLAGQLAEKERLFRLHPDQVWQETEGSRPAQDEVLQLVLADLSANHADTHVLTKDKVDVAGFSFSLIDANIAPLRRAARIIQEDLLILERKESGWHLVAASLSFPSSWSLTEKIGRPMNEIHDPVPGCGTNSRNDSMITRIFDKLPVDAPVKRMNWSINNTPELYLPGDTAGKDPDLNLDNVHVRVERQTLRKLAQTGGIVFSIRIFVHSLAEIMASPGARAYAQDFANQIRALDGPQVHYKGFASKQSALADRILDLAQQQA